MRIQLLVAGNDSDYIEHLVNVLAERYYDTFEVSVCTVKERFASMISNKKYDIFLVENSMADDVDMSKTRLSMLLWDSEDPHMYKGGDMKKVGKYQRVSSIVSDILEAYAEVSVADSYFESKSKITVVWSPIGGCGKTTVALSYAAHAAAEGKKVIYLDMESFSSIKTYFSANGKSISSVFEKLGSKVDLLLQGIRQYDNGSGIYYFCQPENYEDVSILTVEDLTNLVKGCGGDVDEVVVDLSSFYDEKIYQLMDMASRMLLVADNSRAGEAKLKIFRTQNNAFENFKGKTVLVVNKGARIKQDGEGKVAYLPEVQSDDPVVVYKTLSAYFDI